MCVLVRVRFRFTSKITFQCTVVRSVSAQCAQRRESSDPASGCVPWCGHTLFSIYIFSRLLSCFSRSSTQCRVCWCVRALGSTVCYTADGERETVFGLVALLPTDTLYAVPLHRSFMAGAALRLYPGSAGAAEKPRRLDARPPPRCLHFWPPPLGPQHVQLRPGPGLRHAPHAACRMPHATCRRRWPSPLAVAVAHQKSCLYSLGREASASKAICTRRDSKPSRLGEAMSWPSIPLGSP